MAVVVGFNYDGRRWCGRCNRAPSLKGRPEVVDTW
jgi:hypothetical protein